MRLLHEQVVARKGGISRNFTSGVKRWFGGTAPAISTSSLSTANLAAASTNHVYTQESGEMQLRRLADLAFLFQNYQLAHQLYQALKRDFVTDQAWLYYAGSLEMCAICSHLLDPSTKSYPLHYMNNALTHYATTCLRPNLTIRAVLFSTEILLAMGLFKDAADQFLRMTTGDSDLSSALFLEQASRCFLRQGLKRKCALHMVLAGHRFNKATHKSLALRCYHFAVQIYTSSGWNFAEDHVQFTAMYLRKQLGEHLDAFENCVRLLRAPGDHQHEAQQAGLLREYLTIYKQLRDSSGGAKVMSPPVPMVDVDQIVVHYGYTVADGEQRRDDPFSTQSDPFDSADPLADELWARLEMCAWRSTVGTTERSPTHFKPVFLSAGPSTDNRVRRRTPANEPVAVDLPISNYLRVPIFLSNLTLVCASDGGHVSCEPLGDVVLGAEEKRTVRLCVTPSTGVSHLTITGLRLNLTCAADSENSKGASPTLQQQQQPSSSTPTPDVGMMVEGLIDLKVSGPRLNDTKAHRTSVAYAADHRLSPSVTTELWPLLRVELIPHGGSTHVTSVDTVDCFCGQITSFDLKLTNVGHEPVRSVRVAAAAESLFALTAGVEDQLLPSTSVNGQQVWKVGSDRQLALQLGQTVTNTLWLRAPEMSGTHSASIVVFYDSAGGSYRRWRHRIRLNSRPLVDVRCRLSPSQQSTTHPVVVGGDASSSSSSSMLGCMNVRHVGGDAGSITADVQLLRVACVSVSSETVPSLAVERVLSELRDFRLGPGEVDNVCLRLTVAPPLVSSADATVTETWLQSDRPNQLLTGNPSRISSSVLPWPSCLALRPSNRLALLWKAGVMDASGAVSFFIGESWCDVSSKQTILAGGGMQTASSPQGLSLQQPLSVGSALTGDIRAVSCAVRLPGNGALSHNFSPATPACPVPVALEVRNDDSTSSRVLIVVKCVGQPSLNGPPLSPGFGGGSAPGISGPPTQSLQWSGKTQQCATLHPGQSSFIRLKGYAVRPGVYEVTNNLRVEARSADNSVPSSVAVPSGYVTIYHQ